MHKEKKLSNYKVVKSISLVSEQRSREGVP